MAELFLTWLAVDAGARWGDVGCGTGALTEAILRQHAPASVAGIDRATGYVAHARAHLQEARVRLVVGDAMALPWKDERFDATVSGLVLNFLPDAGMAVREMVRVTTPGGAVAAYVWDYSGGMAMMRHFWDVAAALRPEMVSLDQRGALPAVPARAARNPHDMGWAGSRRGLCHQY